MRLICGEQVAYCPAQYSVLCLVLFWRNVLLYLGCAQGPGWFNVHPGWFYGISDNRCRKNTHLGFGAGKMIRIWIQLKHSDSDRYTPFPLPITATHARHHHYKPAPQASLRTTWPRGSCPLPGADDGHVGVQRRPTTCRGLGGSQQRH